jgi:hypothetical protein
MLSKVCHLANSRYWKTRGPENFEADGRVQPVGRVQWETNVSMSPYAYLDEANVSGLLTEALTADVQAVLANDGVAVAAHAAAQQQHKTET